MELTDLRILMTVSSFIVFVGIIAWTWASRRRESFEEAERLPFVDDEPAETAPHSTGALR